MRGKIKEAKQYPNIRIIVLKFEVGFQCKNSSEAKNITKALRAELKITEQLIVEVKQKIATIKADIKQLQ